MSPTGQQTGPKSNPAPPPTRPGAAKGPAPAKMPPRKMWLWFLLVLVANYLLVRLMAPGAEAPITVPYTVFKEEVAKGNVESIYSRGDSIEGRFKAPVTCPPAGDKSAAPKAEPQSTAPRGGARQPAANRRAPSRPRCPPSSTPGWRRS